MLHQVPDAVLGRLALCCYVQQVLDSSGYALGPQQQAAEPLEDATRAAEASVAVSGRVFSG